MFPYTEQAALDQWNQGALKEDEFVRQSHWYKHWGFDWRLYREVFLLAGRGVRFYGVNTPREVVSAVRKKGLAHLTPEEAAHLPATIDTASDEHRRLFRAYFAEGDSTHAAGLSDAAFEGMFQAQCTWDATMAKNAVRILEAADALGNPGRVPEPSRDGSPPGEARLRPRNPRALMVVLLGSGHVAFGLGAPRQARNFFTGPIATVIPVPIVDERGKPTHVRASYADYLWGLPPEPEGSPYPALGASVSDRKESPHPVVTAVSEGSAAAGAGLKVDDRVVSFDGAAMPDKEAFLALMATKRWGDGVTLALERAGKPLTLTVPLRRAAAEVVSGK